MTVSPRTKRLALLAIAMHITTSACDSSSPEVDTTLPEDDARNDQASTTDATVPSATNGPELKDAATNAEAAVTSPSLSNVAADPVVLNGRLIPEVFRGTWGTSAANCSGQDDYGPLRVTPEGFSHYEVTATATHLRKTAPSTVEIHFSSQDAASLENYTFREVWRFDAAGDRLIATTFDGQQTTTSYRPC